jgi:hypothetical protein
MLSRLGARARADLPELDRLESLLPGLGSWGRLERLTTVRSGAREYPVHALVLGDQDTSAPIFLMVGGVHGLERIGTQVVLAYMTTLAERLAWDEVARSGLAQARIAFVPLLNPAGMAERRRANANGVDLMRNAPAHPEGWGTPLVGGQRFSPRLPWYMGDELVMEAESQGLADFVRRELFPASSALVLDVHSGFGMVDRLWFPYARTRRPIPHLCEIYALKRLLDRTLPHHVYRMEPQARTYTVQGDLWDFLYDEYRERQPTGTFLPLTLEMGSWVWVKKNPSQFFSAEGSFNPMVPHRLRRTLRRHLLLFDFLHHAAASPSAWSGFEEASRRALRSEAFDMWYAR